MAVNWIRQKQRQEKGDLENIYQEMHQFIQSMESHKSPQSSRCGSVKREKVSRLNSYRKINQYSPSNSDEKSEGEDTNVQLLMDYRSLFAVSPRTTPQPQPMHITIMKNPESLKHNRKAVQPQKRPTTSTQYSQPARPLTSQAPGRQRRASSHSPQGNMRPSSPELPEFEGPPVSQCSPGKGEMTATKPQRRYRPGERALMEIIKYQDSTGLLIRKAPFSRLVREISMKYSCGVPYSWQGNAIKALQVAAEAYITELFEDACMGSRHAKRATLRVTDMQLARKFRGIQDKKEKEED